MYVEPFGLKPYGDPSRIPKPLKGIYTLTNESLHQIAADTRATSGPIVADKVWTN